MDYKVEEASDTAMLHKLALPPAADGQSRGEPSDRDDLEAFSNAISRQAEARAARYAIGFGRREIERKIRDFEREQRLSLGRSFNLVLTFTLGVAVYAGIMYVILGAQLHSPLPTPPLPPPGATA
jgi:hypothetical protein